MNEIDRKIRPICLDIKDPERATMLSIITASSCARIHIEDVEYLEQFGRKLDLMTGDLQYSVYDYLDNLVPYFKGTSFFRVMRGLLVNFDKVRNIDEDSIYFESGNVITLGRNNMCKTRNAFKKYLKEYPIYNPQELHLMVAEQNG